MKYVASAIAVSLGLAFCGHAVAQQTVKIGVLEDMSGFYADITGPGSVLAAKMAVDDFGGKVLGRPIEVLSADHQNKADIGATIARQWYEVDKVGMVTGLGNSSVALAVQSLAAERGLIDIVTSGGSSDLTGKACSPTGFHWVYDSYSLAKTTAQAVVAAGGKSWFFMTANYAFGQAAQRDSTQFINQAGGKVVGAVLVPPNSSDFSSFLLQAQSSKAQVVGLASAGSDMSNAVKQAGEFGLVDGGQTMAGLIVFITDIHALGLKSAHGMYLTEAFYWDLDDKTREWSKRFFSVRKAMPTMAQAGVYSATTHYLKAVKAAGTDEPGVVNATMRDMPIDDFWSDKVRIREDGRVMREMYLFRVKNAKDSKAPWDYYDLVSKVKPDDAFRPLAESDCPLVKK
jgi:branched-chain amino acid transport system substrate-binding protein